MALATLSTTVNRVVTDRRDWTSTIAAHGAVRHWWSLVPELTYEDPTAQRLRLRPRIGDLEMYQGGSGVMPWQPEGGYQAATFLGVSDQRVFETAFPRLNGVWSMVSIKRTLAELTEDWGLSFTGQPSATSSFGARIYNIPRRNGTNATVKMALPGDENQNYGAPAPLDSRTIAFQSFDMATGAMKGAHGAADPVSANFANWAAAMSTATATWSLYLGQGQHNQPYHGRILDFLMVQGDIFSAPLSSLRSDLLEYFTTVYRG